MTNTKRTFHGGRDLAPNMTALVNIVMVLLIFLMLAGGFGGATRFLKSKGFGAHAASRQPNGQFQIDVLVSQNLDGSATITSGKIITQDVNVLTKAMADQLKAHRDAGLDVDHIQIVLRPAKKVRYASVIQVYEALLRAGYTRVSFATT